MLAKIVVFEVDEPLLGGAKNHGIVAAPAMRITVLQFSLANQRAARFEELDEAGVGFEDRLAFVFGQTFDETAIVIEGSVSVDAVFLTGAKIVGTVARSGVDDSRALLERDIVGEDGGLETVEEGMGKFQMRGFEFAAFVSGEEF